MRFERLDLNLLVALDALLETRSVTAAAQQIYLSQSGMTGALNRLREYFEDDLLVNVGRRMMLTPRAEELAQPVRSALLLIKSTVTTPSEFDPTTSTRHFLIVASDYAYNVLLADVLREASAEAPGVSFEITPPDARQMERLERGEVDLFLTLNHYLSDEFPKKRLFDDEHVVVCWTGNKHCDDGITEEKFYNLSHVVVFFGPDRHPAFSEEYLATLGRNRRIEVQVPVFSALPRFLIGTDRIATMYRRHAELLSLEMPIRILPMPMPMPNIVEAMQWHNLRHRDRALHWLLGHMERSAAQLPAFGS